MANSTYSLSFSGSQVDDLLTKVSVASGSLMTSQSIVTSSQIGTAAVGPSQIAQYAVATDHIAENAVTTVKILNGAVTGEKIASDAALNIGSLMISSATAATQAWVNSAINSAVLAAIDSEY